VSLWNVSNPEIPLATAIVEAGQVSPLCLDGYRYAPITPTLLVPGVTYVVAAFWPRDDGTGNFDPYPELQLSNTPVTPDPRITIGQARHLLSGGPNQFPSVIAGAGPIYVGLVNFRLEAGACEPNPPANLATTFQGGSGQAGNMFDVTDLSGRGLRITGFQINLNNAATNQTPITVSIYSRQGSFVGHETDPSAWQFIRSVSVRSWGANQPTPVPAPVAVFGFSTTGVFITTDFITGQPPPNSPPFLNYTDIGPASPTYSNADVRISGGVGKANPRFTGATFQNKMWNGGIVYTLGGCYADCNLDQALNVMDFICYQSMFAQGAAYADCDRNGLWNVNDFLCYLSAFAASYTGGCP
jgi:hypothetical protein